MEYKQIKTNIPAADYKKIQDKAKEENLKLSGYLKKILFQNNLISEISKKRKKKYKPINQKLLYELNRIGINLNQIVKKINKENELDYLIFSEIETIKQDIKEILKKELLW